MVATTAKITNWGGSKGIRIPKDFLDDLNLQGDNIVQLIKEDDKIIIKKAETPLDEIFKNYKGDYKSTEWDLGEEMGREKVW